MGGSITEYIFCCSILDGGGLVMTNVLGGKFASAVVRGTCFNVTARMGTVSGESGVAGT